ncbi:hypothetical protein JTE90_021553 [Oedothorax gibbosus]|uniref:DNA polymerase lambda n=1 Tax=Oedothorax gibbosus TaxID=931172 RepID=A0AAV6VNT6_9ARAC|nr:hypothetical protein JTE90_021553 [Oedothorax gibbosus]
MFGHLIKNVRSAEEIRRRNLPSSVDTDKEDEETPDPDPNGIFKGLRFFFKFGDNRTSVLRNLIKKHGGIYVSKIEYGPTHILLSDYTSGGWLCKNQNWEGIPMNIVVVSVNWFSECIEANRLVPYAGFYVACPRIPPKPFPESGDTENSQVVEHTEASGEDNFIIREREYAHHAEGFYRNHYESTNINNRKFWSPVNSCSEYEDFKFNEETTCDDEWLEVEPPSPSTETDSDEDETDSEDETESEDEEESEDEAESNENEEVNNADRMEVDKNNEEMEKDDDVIILDEIIAPNSAKEKCVPGPSTSKRSSSKQTSHRKNLSSIPGPNLSESVAHCSYMEPKSPELIVLDDTSEPSESGQGSPSQGSLSSASRPKSSAGTLTRLRLRIKVDKSSKEKIWKIVDNDTDEESIEKPQSHKRKKKHKHNSLPSSPDLQNEIMDIGEATVHENMESTITLSRRRKHKKNKHKRSCLSPVAQANNDGPEEMLVEENLLQEMSSSTKEQYPHHKKFRRSVSTPTSPIGNEEPNYKDLAASNSRSNSIPSTSTAKSQFEIDEPNVKDDSRKIYSAPNTQTTCSTFCRNIDVAENILVDNIQDKFPDKMLSNTDLPNEQNLNKEVLEEVCDPNNTCSIDLVPTAAIPDSGNNIFDVGLITEPHINNQSINEEDLVQENMFSNDLASSTAIADPTSDKILSGEDNEPGLDSKSVIVPDYDYYDHKDTLVKISCSNIQDNLCTVSGNSRKRKRIIEDDLNNGKEIDQLSETDVSKSNVSEVNHDVSNKKNNVNSSVLKNTASLPNELEQNNYKAEVLAKIKSGGFSENSTAVAPYRFKVSDLPRVGITVKVPPLAIPSTSRCSVDQFMYEQSLQDSGVSINVKVPPLAIPSTSRCSVDQFMYEQSLQESGVSINVKVPPLAIPSTSRCSVDQFMYEQSLQESTIFPNESTVPQQVCTVIQKECAVPQQESTVFSKQTAVIQQESTIPEEKSTVSEDDIVPSDSRCASSFPAYPTISDLCSNFNNQIDSETRDEIIKRVMLKYRIRKLVSGIDKCIQIEPILVEGENNYLLPTVAPTDIDFFAPIPPVSLVPPSDASYFPKEEDTSKVKNDSSNKDLGHENTVSSIENSKTESFNGNPTDTTATIVVDDLLDELECKWKMDMELNDPQDMDLSNNFNDLPINEICLIQEDLTNKSINDQYNLTEKNIYDRRNEVKHVSGLSNVSESKKIDKISGISLDGTVVEIVEDLLNELDSDVNDSKKLDAKSHVNPTIAIEEQAIDLTDKYKKRICNVESSLHIVTNLLKDLLNKLESKVTDYQGLENKCNRMPPKEINDIDMALKGEIVTGFDDKIRCIHHSSLCSDTEEMDLGDCSKSEEFNIDTDKIVANLLEDLFAKLMAESDTEKIVGSLFEDLFAKLKAEADTEKIAANLLKDLLDKLEVESDLRKPEFRILESLKYDMYPVQLFSREDLITMSRIKRLKGYKQTDSVKAEIKNLYEELEKGTPVEVGCQTDDESVVVQRIRETEELEQTRRMTYGFWGLQSELDRTVNAPPLNTTNPTPVTNIVTTNPMPVINPTPITYPTPVNLSLSDLVDETDSNSETPNLNRPDASQRVIFFPFPRVRPISEERIEPTPAALPINLPNQKYYLRPSCPNFKVISKMQELYDFIKVFEGPHRVTAYEKAIFALGRYHKRIESLEEVQNIDGISRKIAFKVWEIMRTGDLEELKLFGSRRFYNAKKLLRKSWGITTRVVKELFLKDVTTVKGALEHDSDILDVSQRLSLSYFDDLKRTISKAEAEAIVEIVSGCFKSINDKLEIEACSSLRRNEFAHSKVAVLVVLEKGVEKNRHLLDDVVADMHKQGYIIDDLKRHEVNGSQSKYAGIFRINKFARYRKLDIWVVPYVEKICATLFMTGPSYFVRAMVRRAEKQAMVLDEHGIRHRILNKNGGTEYVFMSGMNTEEDLFEHLNVPYRDPCMRRYMPIGVYRHNYDYPEPQ